MKYNRKVNENSIQRANGPHHMYIYKCTILKTLKLIVMEGRLDHVTTLNDVTMGQLVAVTTMRCQDNRFAIR